MTPMFSVSNKLARFVTMAVVVLTSNVITRAENAPPGKEKVGIGKVKITPSLVASAAKAGVGDSLGRIVEAMDAQLMDALHQTRKFELIARSDLDVVLREQGLVASGNVDTDDTAACHDFKIAGCKYLAVATVDDFQDFKEEVVFEGLGERATKRIIRLSAVIKIYDTTTGSLKESTNIQLEPKEITSLPGFAHSNGRLDDRLLIEVTRMMCERSANRIVDVIYPARITGVTDHVATISRGDGTAIGVGQLWDIFALGQDMTDPDTGEVIREEVPVGQIRIISVLPKFSKGEILSDRGVANGCIARLTEVPDVRP